MTTKFAVNKKGKIFKGDSTGSYIFITEESFGYKIYFSSDFNFEIEVYDYWVEDMDSLQKFFEESSWQINWHE